MVFSFCQTQDAHSHIFFFHQLPDERRLDLLKALAEVAPFTTPQDSRQILPSVVQLLKVL